MADGSTTVNGKEPVHSHLAADGYVGIGDISGLISIAHADARSGHSDLCARRQHVGHSYAPVEPQAMRQYRRYKILFRPRRAPTETVLSAGRKRSQVEIETRG